MTIKMLFLLTVMFAFAFFSIGFVNLRTSNHLLIPPRLQISIFLAFQFVWLAANTYFVTLLQEAWKTPPGTARQLLRAAAVVSCVTQFFLVCLITPTLAQY
ncbi:hypothetical protein Mal15_11690 [Stieleria maiorica]|uniref:Uncharacterized protein n=1 Tax=Stieleria maiorica TaxID=2795974 RepID=A0A5B9M7J0_9BACT|nr:hypothetical protein [Stieleria maiorica]QEF97131.1 hypothetical protein Mal15_11690 [Stieleria maiorica]